MRSVSAPASAAGSSGADKADKNVFETTVSPGRGASSSRRKAPSGASAGERRVFALLQQLPDDVIVYYEPVVADRYPDFIVIIPSVGLLVIEVKGWYPNHILEAINNEVTIIPQGRPGICKNPVLPRFV